MREGWRYERRRWVGAPTRTCASSACVVTRVLGRWGGADETVIGLTESTRWEELNFLTKG